MDDSPKLHVRIVGRDGRRRYDPSLRYRLVAEWLEPGVSVSRLALEHGVNANLVRKRIKKARENRQEGFLTSDGRFVTRREAMVIAATARQVDCDCVMLISQHLW